jgi:RND family efflux transporter MFP subunit
MSPRCPIQAPAALILLLFAPLALGGCQRGAVAAESPAEPPPTAVRTVLPRAGTLEEGLDYVGTVQARREVRVMAQVPGTVARLHVAEGDAVGQGVPLLELAAPDLEARVRRLEADVRRARAEADHRCAVSETDRRLLESGAITRLAADGSALACESARAGALAAGAGLDEARALRARTQERAPFDGRVLQQLVEPGQAVMPGQPLLVVGDEGVEVRVRVTEADIRRGIVQGTPVRLSLAGGATFRTEVATIGPVATGPMRTTEVVVSLPGDTGARLHHGTSVDVTFVLGETPDAVAVPQPAILEDAAGPFILLVEADRVRRHRITPGTRAGGWVAVAPPPPTDTPVALGDVARLEDGARVYPVAVALP